MDYNYMRKSFLKLLNKLPVGFRKGVFLPFKKKGILITMLMATMLIAVSTLTLAVLNLVYPSIIIGSGGTVDLPVGVGFYWDSNCTARVAFIDWGNVQPASVKDVTFFVRNEGSQPITLNITAENWTPIESASYMTFSKDYMSSTINPQEILQITLSLTTSSQIEDVTNFWFDINVAINVV